MKTFIEKFSALAIIIVLLFSLIGCTDNNGTNGTQEVPATNTQTPVSNSDPLSEIWSNAKYKEDTELGEGSKTIVVKVIVGKNAVKFTLKTDAETLGEALIDNNIVEGEMAQYGLYIKYANGIRADYSLDGAYWGLTQNGEYLMTGADKTNINDGEKYELTYVKEYLYGLS